MMFYPMGRYNLNFDISAMAVLLVLLFFQVYLSMNRRHSDKAFMALVVVMFFACFFDLWAVVMRNAPSLFPYNVAVTCHICREATHALIFPSLYVFAAYYSKRDQHFSGLENVLIVIPFVLYLTVLIVPGLRNQFYHLGTDGSYWRKPLYVLSIGFALWYVVLSLQCIFRRRRTMGVNLYWLAALLLGYVCVLGMDLYWTYLKASDFMGVMLLLVAAFVLNRADTVRWRVIGIYDALSTIKNRSGLRSDAHEVSGKPMSVAIMDIDKFKHFNDTYGHQRGDEAIRHCGHVLQRVFPDTCYRYGGDEFVVLTKLRGQEFVSKLEQLRSEVAAGKLHGVKDPVFLTIGYCFGAPGNIDEVLTLLEQADENLYRGKHNDKIKIVGPDTVIDEQK